MKVGFATVDWSRTVTDDYGIPVMGGSGYIRIGQYLPYLDVDYVFGAPSFDWDKGIFGVHLMSNSEQFVNPDNLLETDPDPEDFSWDCDVIYLQRNMHVSVPEAIIAARKNGQIVINDVDDWYWGLHKGNAAYWASDPKTNYEYNRDHYKKSLEVSSAVVVSTPFLQDKIKDWNGRTYLLQNHVDINSFNGDIRIASEGNGLVGWTGSTAHRSDDLSILKPFANQFDWVHVGDSEGSPTFSGLTSAKSVVTHNLVGPKEYPRLFDFSVGVVPLSSNKFNEAKSWIKGLEYAAAGIPFVASKSSEYLRLQNDFEIGATARSTADWVKWLKKFVSSDSLRKETALQNWTNAHWLDVSLGAIKLEEFLTL